MKQRVLVAIVGLMLGSLVMIQVGDAWARAGSGGSRGSRSYSAPARPTPASPTTPSRSVSQPAPAPASRPFGGLLGGLAGFAIGGLLGSMLFGGLGHGFGIGMMDILLIGGGLALLMMFLRRRRQVSQPVPAYAGAPSSAYGGDDRSGPSSAGPATMEMPAGTTSDVERGLGYIRSMDATLDPDSVVTLARRTFLRVQQAVAARDVQPLRDTLVPEMYDVLQAQVDRLRSARQTDHIDEIDIRRAEITEAWQESGRDYVSVGITASMLDYTVDDTSGGVVDGSRTNPQDVEEYWTFTRPVGNNPWRLSAIQTS